jgi:hypothetical protein
MNWLWASGIVGSLAAGWGQIKNLWSQISSLVVTQVVVQDRVVDAVLVYLQDNCRQMRIGPRSYAGQWINVRKLNRTQLVAWRLMGRLGAWYFMGKMPIRITQGKTGDKYETDYVSLSPNTLKLSFPRWAYDPDALIDKMVRYFNGVRDDFASQSRNRHYIRRIYGLSKKRAIRSNTINEQPYPEKEVSGDAFAYRTAIPIGHDRNDLGVPVDHTLDALALSDLAMQAIQEAKRWKESEMWYKEHSLPWRRGWLLYGRPGTGKTALARALAESLDLPVFIYDLASLANDEFQFAWREMLSTVPCIALIEDIDATFEFRKTLVGDLTFDCLLNCLDGIERADGLFTIITTNDPGKLDHALGIADETGRSTRPGRVDRAILMACPDVNGRLKIAKRILAEHPDLWTEVALAGTGETGAQFQERCASMALKLYWDAKSLTREE